MRIALAALALVAACTDAPDDNAPTISAKYVGTFAVEWIGGANCAPPAPFADRPAMVEIDPDGEIRWGDGIVHRGTEDPVRDELQVPEATESGTYRFPYYITTGGAIITDLSWEVDGEIVICALTLTPVQ